ncbi:MAG TPA: hypothetical protein PK990_04790 [Salinivirgaceae bacterium]|nr:hypothetical protein [Salinivirgaceae bacterium]
MKSEIVAVLEISINKNVCRAFVDEYKKRPSVADDLWKIIVASPQKNVSSRAMWVLSHIFDFDPDLRKNFTEKLVQLFIISKNPSVNRLLAKHLMNCTVSEIHETELLNVSFERLLDRTQPVGVRVNCMSIVFMFVKKYPELSHELISIIEQEMCFGEQALRSRGQKILKEIRRKTL